MSQQQVIVSLTSFPPAIPYAIGAIKSILEGTVKPDKIVLYLSLSQFPENKIPQEIQELSDTNPIFEILNYEPDIRSYRKLIPALKDFPEAIIVTIDDDVCYHRNMLRDLLVLHKEIPNAILAHRAKRIKVDAPYKKWKKYRWYSFLFRRLHFSYLNIQTGVGGVLYPPHSLQEEMFEPTIFREIAPTTDDIWFWAAAVAKGTQVVPLPYGKHNKPKGLKKPKELSLKTTNFKTGTDLNKTALDKILKQYPIIKGRIKKEK
jgi:Deoxyribodipyrimidine photolyase